MHQTRILGCLFLMLLCGWGGRAGATDPAPATGGADPAQLVRAIGGGETVTDRFGDPFIRARTAEGLAYDITFYDCEDGAACTSVTFTAIYERPEEVERKDWHSLRDLSEWNAKRRFGKVWLDDDGRVLLEHSATLAGGAPDPLVRDLVARWAAALTEFHATFID